MSLLRRRPAGAVLALLLASLIAAGPARAAETAAAALPAIESFFENAAFSGAILSPNGKYLAARVGRKGKRDGLAVVDLTTDSAQIVAGFSDSDIGHFDWVSNERLVYNAVDKKLGPGDVWDAPGLYAVNRDGGEFRQLAARGAGNVREHSVSSVLPWNAFMLGQRGAQDSPVLYVQSPKFEDGEIDHVNLLRLDTATGRASAVNRPAHTRGWLLDHKGEPRIAQALEREQAVFYYRDPGTEQWRKLAAFNAYTGAGKSFSPLAFGPDGTLYVTASAGRDKIAL
jgi:hypothetical protein